MADPTHIAGYDAATRVLEAYVSPRSRFLDRLERYYFGTQYAHLKSWWDDDVPLQERAPCIRYDAPKSAIRDIVAMVLGEGKFPRITAHAGEDDSELDDETGLPEADSRTLDAFVNGPLAKHVRLRANAKKLLREAMRSKTAVALLCIRGGRLCIETEPAKWCAPEFVAGTRRVVSLEIRYPYLKQLRDDQGDYVVQTWIYRRVIDGARDVTYLPAKAIDNGAEPTSWVEDPALTVAHGLGFCPVLWYPRQAEHCVPGDYDGVAIHDTQLEALDAINLSLSQRHRAALYVGDPQPVETGVAEDVEPSETGRLPTVYVDQAEKGVYISKRNDGGKTARRKGPGIVWRYPNENSKVSLLTLPGDALQPITDHAHDLRAKILESFAVVSLDPENATHAAEFSGVAIKRLYMRMTSSCDDERDDFGDNGLLPLVDMLLRVVLVVWAKGQRLLITGFDKVAPILARFATADGDWLAPDLVAVWGEYFDDSAEDELNRVTMATTARAGGLVPLEQAVEKLAPVFNIKNAAEVAEQLTKEADDNRQKALADAKALAATKGSPDNGDDQVQRVQRVGG